MRFQQLLGFLAIAVALACEAEPTIIGTWELTYVAPTNVDYTGPGGVMNTKFHFTEDGKLFALKPEEISIAGAHSTEYKFDGKQLTILNAGSQPKSMAVSFPDSETMILHPRYESQRKFKRIASFNSKLEPRSLQLVQDRSTTITETTYDLTDYSKLPVSDRLIGIWEVMAYSKVPRNQAPPYGFFNDLWTIKKDTVLIARREPPASDSVRYSLANNQISSSGIGLGGPAGSKIDWNYSFNEWGHLVLDSPYCRLTLKLISKDTTQVMTVPLKIVLLSLKGEE